MRACSRWRYRVAVDAAAALARISERQRRAHVEHQQIAEGKHLPIWSLSSRFVSGLDGILQGPSSATSQDVRENRASGKREGRAPANTHGAAFITSSMRRQNEVRGSCSRRSAPGWDAVVLQNSTTPSKPPHQAASRTSAKAKASWWRERHARRAVCSTRRGSPPADALY